jgi:uncharacterized protein YjbI with pentapeptide repeats
MSEIEDPTIFADLATSLGLTNAELFSTCHKAGIPIFDQHYQSLTLTSDQVQTLTTFVSSQVSEVPTKGTNSKKKQRETKMRQLRKPPAPAIPVLVTVQDFSEHYGLALDRVKQLCSENAITSEQQNWSITKHMRKELHSILINYIASPDAEAEVPNSLQDLLNQALAEPESAKKTQPAARQERVTHKRIAVLTRELGISEPILLFIIDALQIPFTVERNPKIEIRHQEDIAVALSMLNELKIDSESTKNIRAQVLCEHFGVSLRSVLNLCIEKGIPVRNKKQLSAHGVLRVGTLLNDPVRLNGIKRLDQLADSNTPSNPTEETTTKEIVEVIDYQGVSLVRQNFEGFSFENAEMTKVDLSHSVLVGASFISATICGGLFKRVLAHKANLNSVNAVEAIFDHADLSNTSLVGATCTNAVFTNANLRNADLTNAVLTGADIRFANLSGVIISNTTWVDGTVVNALPSDSKATP